MQISDEEEEEEEDNEDDDESNQTSESEEEVEDEEVTIAENVALQTSLNSTLNSPPSPINGKSSNTNGARRSQRFANHSPVSPVRSTASYLNSQTPITSTPMAFPPNSPLRKAVAKNSSAFGSLGKFTFFRRFANIFFYRNLDVISY